MNIINRWILFFLLLVFVLFFGIVQVLQTSYVGQKISKELTSQILSKYGLEIKFEKVEIGLFPPSSYFKNVKLNTKKNTLYELSLEAASFGVQFSFLDLFSQKFSISKVIVFDAKVKLKTPEEKEKKVFELKDLNKLNFKELFSYYRKNIFEKMPIKIYGLKLEEIDLDIDSKNFFIDKFSVELTAKKIITEGTVENENLIIFSALYPGEQEIEFNLELSEKGTKVNKIKFKNRFDFIRFEGKLNNVNNLLEIEGGLDFFVRTETLSKAFPKLIALKKMEGMIYGRSKISKTFLDPDLTFQLSIYDFVSDYIDLNEIELDGEKKGKEFTLRKLKGTEGKSTVEIKEQVKFLDIEKINLNNFKTRIVVNNFFSNNILKYVPALKPIKGDFSGEFQIILENHTISFILGKDFVAKNFVLQFEDVGKPILKNEAIKVDSLKVTVLPGGYVGVNGNLIIGESNVSVEGKVLGKENSLEFKAISNPIFDFMDLGPISGIDLKGKGAVDLQIKGPTKEVKIKLNSELKDFGFLGFNIGDINGEIEYDINKKTLTVQEMNSVINNSEMEGSGKIVFGENSNIDFHILTPHITYQDSLFIYQPLVKDMSWLKQKDDFEYISDYKISGPIDPKKLIVKGYFKGGESTFLGEQINSFEGKYQYQNQKVKISNFTLNKGKGKVFINSEYDVPTSDFEYTAEVQGVRLNDFEFINFLNLGLDGELVGISKGDRKQNLLRTNTSFNLLSTKIGIEEVNDSKIEIETEGKKVKSSGSFFGKYLSFKSLFDFSPSKESKDSFFDIKIQADRLPLLTGIISSHNIVNPSYSGELYADFTSSFNLKKPEFLNLNLKINSFNWKNENSKIGLISNKNTIQIKNGQIDKWDVEFRGIEKYFISKGLGNISNEFTITNDFLIDPQILQLLTPNIQQIRGSTQGKFILNGKFPKVDYTFSLNGVLNKLKLFNFPGIFEDFQLSLSHKNSILTIEKFKGKYGKGDVNVGGTVKLLTKEPQININYEFSNINFPFFKKSTANFSGKGFLQGDSRPYNLTGDFLLGFAEIRDTPKDLMKGQSPSVDYNRWLPKKVSKEEGAIVKLDLKMDLANRLAIKNKMADILLGGEINVSGDNKNKIIGGTFSAIPRISKFTFKGNSFAINEGVVELQNYPKDSPYLRLSASSIIKKYDVKVNANGKGNKLIIDLSSEPTLSREDILSLITLGFTSRDTVGLSEKEKETMTSVGIGSLLADQLEISQGLTSDFGINLSVTPELEEIEKTNQPKTREGSVLPTQSKFRSATRIGFKKQISEKSEISFSNTVGGSINQKQEVSGEYFLNKNTSVKGTYEMFNSANREVQDSGAQSNNLGVDLIFKWSFK